MPAFTPTTHAPAPVEEVWKLLHDPGRYPEWWEGIETVATGADGAYPMCRPVTPTSRWLSGCGPSPATPG